jgi:hypothetical protein
VVSVLADSLYLAQACLAPTSFHQRTIHRNNINIPHNHLDYLHHTLEVLSFLMFHQHPAINLPYTLQSFKEANHTLMAHLLQFRSCLHIKILLIPETVIMLKASGMIQVLLQTICSQLS